MNTGLNFPSGNPIDAAGNLAPQWRMFFLTLFTRTGGSDGNDTSTLQAAITKANANIGDLQTEDAQGTPAPDMAAVFGLIHVVEAIATQAMAAASQQPDERGEAGESASVTHLSQRVAELEAQIEQLTAPAVNLSDLQAMAADGHAITGVPWDAPPPIGTTAPNTAVLSGLTVKEPGSSTSTLTVDGSVDPSGANLQFIGDGATTPKKTIRVHGGILQIANSAYSAILLSLDDSGNLTAGAGLSFTPATTTTAPSAGGAGALPATPTGYATVTIGGTARKIAYY